MDTIKRLDKFYKVGVDSLSPVQVLHIWWKHAAMFPDIKMFDQHRSSMDPTKPLIEKKLEKGTVLLWAQQT